MNALLLTLVLAADPSPPAWPAREHLLVGTWQLVFDAPPTTEAELLRRQGRYGFELRWHAVSGVTTWRVFREKQLVATLGAEARSFQSEAKGAARYSVEGCNEQHLCTRQLTAMVAFEEPGEAVADEGSLVGGSIGEVLAGRVTAEPDEPARAAWSRSLGEWVKQRFEAQLRAGPPVEAGTVAVVLTVKRDGTIVSARVVASGSAARDAFAKKLFEGASAPAFSTGLERYQLTTSIKLVFPE
ncbi:MAG: hypothetical protein JNM69_31465 [Archangium sp.]|nr:hypothetical protein [Archangium sp.]